MSKLIIEVCKIDSIKPHENADKLRIATIKGWNIIVGLDDYKEGELVVFCPPDSVISNNLIEKYKLEYLRGDGRVKTVKLRGFISQGLVLPLPEGKMFKLGQDVAQIMGITKYEPPVRRCNLSGNQSTKKKRNPLFDKYTDIDNIQNFNTVFKDGDVVVISEKLHGTNTRYANLPISEGYTFLDRIRYLWKKYILKKEYEFVYGSHNVQKTPLNKKMGFYGEDVYGKIAKKYKLAEIIDENYIIYGEIYGKKIQELEYGLKDIDVRFFAVKYKGNYLNWTEFSQFCIQRNLPIVPILHIGIYHSQDLAKYTTGKSIIAPNQIREGCVVLSLVEENHPRIGRKILKSINPEYLAKKNRTDYH